ncbi:MAG: four helix bundle protein [Marinilabiliaceae bacterium]|nr:four helix bundle protein [Marinilabiliaceae bacterium]
MKNYKKLKIWQQGIQIVKMTYEVTKCLPDSEKYNLVSQMNRASVSIPSNIAEGSSRSSDKDYHRFLEIALGSSFELDTQIEIVLELGLIEIDLVNNLQSNLLEEIMMLQSLMNKLNVKQ